MLKKIRNKNLPFEAAKKRLKKLDCRAIIILIIKRRWRQSDKDYRG